MSASALYFIAAALLIFIAAFFSARKVQRQVPLKWVIGVAVLTLLVLGLIWLALTVLAPKGSTPQTPPEPPAYPTPTGSG